MKKLAVLLSGRGSNFVAIHEAILRGEIDASIVAVLGNRPGAPGLERASQAGYETFCFEHSRYDTRQEHERELVAIIENRGADFVVLAGYMRLLSDWFVARFRHRILNIHPSLLPAFPGVDAQRQALEYGVRISGCTVHFVDEGLDQGPIVVQRAVPLTDGETVESLSAKILVEEHRAYPEAIRRVTSEPYRIEGRRVVFAA